MQGIWEIMEQTLMDEKQNMLMLTLGLARLPYSTTSNNSVRCA
jgi:hypothetical protein